MESLNYKSVLKRGFALVRNASGKPVMEAAAVSPGETLSLTFRDGTKDVKAT